MSALTEPPLVSVVLPTRGRPELVRESVLAVVAQDYAGPLECLVVHDQEPVDASLGDLSRQNRTVRVMENPGRSGLAAARNSGLAHVAGQYIASCDDDDVWHPSKLRLQMERMLGDPSIVVLGAGIRLLMADDRVVEWPGESRVITRQQLLTSRRKELHSSTLLIKRSVFDRIGGYDEDLPQGYAEDYEFLLRAMTVGTIGVVNVVLADIRKNNQSWFRERSENVAAALIYLLQIHPELAETRYGHARVLGQIAVAKASLGQRKEAAQWTLQALRRWPLAPHALLALAMLATRVDPGTALSLARRAGRGIT